MAEYRKDFLPLNSFTPTSIHPNKSFNSYLYILTLICIQICLFALFYGKFGDLIVDSSREATIPWRILNGQIIYKDFFYEYGPLTPYLLALLYKIFTPHLLVLQGAGLFCSITVSILIYRICYLFIQPIYSFITSLVFIFIFSFQFYGSYNIFNFIFPYSYAATFGILTLLLFIYKSRTLLNENKNIISSGIFFGLSCLTKIEIIFASASWVFSLFAILFLTKAHPISIAKKCKKLILFLLSAGAIILPTFFYLSQQLNLIQYIQTELFSISKAPTASLYLHAVMGTNQLGLNLKNIFLSISGTALLLFFYFGMDRFNQDFFQNQKKLKKLAIHFICFVILLSITYAVIQFWIDWTHIFSGLNFLIFSSIIFYLFNFLLKTKESEIKKEDAFLFCLSITAFTLLSRKIFNINAMHYGFYLTIPGLILFSLILYRSIPNYLKKTHSDWRFYHLGVSIFFLCAIYFHFSYSLQRYQSKTMTLVTSKGKLILTPDQFKATNECLKYFEPLKNTPFQLLVLPEGSLFNFLTDSLPIQYYHSSGPDFFRIKAERELFFIQELQKQKPNYILIATRWTDEYGYSIIGKDYLQIGMRYIFDRYQQKEIFGMPPFDSSGQFGILLLEKKPEPL